MPKISLNMFLRIVLGFIVMSEYFMEKHLCLLWPWVFRWYRPFWYLFDLAGVSVPYINF